MNAVHAVDLGKWTWSVRGITFCGRSDLVEPLENPGGMTVQHVLYSAVGPAGWDEDAPQQPLIGMSGRS